MVCVEFSTCVLALASFKIDQIDERSTDKSEIVSLRRGITKKVYLEGSVLDTELKSEQINRFLLKTQNGPMHFAEAKPIRPLSNLDLLIA